MPNIEQIKREIKFRSWDRKKKQFDTCRNGGDHMNFSLDYKGINSISRPFKVYQQYTGLKDKNGKEIYESDLVEYSSFENGKEVYEVQFIAGGFKFVGKNVKGWIEPNKDIENCKIIGNIYENPDLLSTKLRK